MIFNGKTEKDYGLILLEKQIQSPNKKKVKEEVPFVNGSYDFSTIATNGEIVYDDRPATCRFAIIANSKTELNSKYTNALDWLMNTGKQKLKFDDIPGYYFMAEVESSPGWKEKNNTGELTVNFICEPFKYRDFTEDEQLWDSFDFTQDALQTLEYTVAGTMAVTIINTGITKAPIINCSSTMTAVYKGKTYNLDVGNNQYWSLKLSSGENTLTLNGNGTVKFIFTKEVL